MLKAILIILSLYLLALPAFAQEVTPLCGSIIYDVHVTPIPEDECLNPFNTLGDPPYNIEINNSVVLPHDVIRFSSRQWLHIAVPELSETHHIWQVYKKDGSDYITIFGPQELYELDEEYSDTERLLLELQYARSTNTAYNYRALLRIFTPEAPLDWLQRNIYFRRYMQNSMLLDSGEYILVLTTFNDIGSMIYRYQLDFSITITHPESIAHIPLGPTFVMDPEFRAQIIPTVERNQIAMRAANLATELVQTDNTAYNLGLKGWDYHESAFTTATKILTGYRPTAAYVQATDTGLPVGLDCSGLIMWAYNRSYNAALPANDNFIKYFGSWQQAYESQSDAVDLEELLPGDALFYDFSEDGKIDHVAMYVGEREHSETGGYEIVNATSEDVGITRYTRQQMPSDGRFKGAYRPHVGNKELEIKTLSPVDMIVVAPDGQQVSFDDYIESSSEGHRGTEDFTYIEMDQGHDGQPIDVVYSAKVIPGVYQIVVIPDETATAESTYSLHVTIQGQTQVLVDNEPIGDVNTPKAFEFSVLVPEQAASDDKPGKYVAADKSEHAAKSKKSKGRSSSTRVSSSGKQTAKKSAIKTELANTHNPPLLNNRDVTAFDAGAMKYVFKKFSHASSPLSIIVFNQITSDTTEVLLFQNTENIKEPMLYTIKNNTLQRL